MTNLAKTSVHVLTAENVKEKMSNKDIGCGILLVHAEWCGHCRDLLPKYIEFANSMPCFTSFAITDAELKNVSASDKKLLNLPNVEAFPTLFAVKSNKCQVPELNLAERTKVGLIAEAMAICPETCKCKNNMVCKKK